MQQPVSDREFSLTPYQPPSAADNQANIFKQAALNGLRQWWMIAFPIGLVLAAAATGLVYLFHVPQYQARATLLIKPTPEFIVTQSGSSLSDRFVRTQQEFIRSALVLGPVVSRDEIATLPEISGRQQPIDWLAETVELRSVGNSDLYELTYTGPEPKNAADIVNAVADSYFKLVDEHEAQRDSRLIDLLSREREEHVAKVTRLRDTVRQLTKETTGKDPFKPEVEVVEASSPLTILRSQLTKVAVDEAMLRAELAALHELDTANQIEIKEDEVNEFVNEHESVRGLESQIENKLQLARGIAAASALGEKDRRFQEKHDEIRRDRELLEKTRSDLRQSVREELLVERRSAREVELASKRADLDSATLLHGILEKRLKTEVVEQSDLSEQMLNLEFKRDELQRAETVFEKINDRIVTLQTELRAPRQVELLKAAIAPSTPVEQYPLKLMVLAGGAAFCFPLLLAFGWECRMQRLSDVQQLAAFSKVPVVAEIASFPAGARTRRKSLSRRVSRALRHFEESVHSLRTFLVLSKPLTDMKVLTVTSSISQEGKTSVATQLALSYSRSTGRVLLIDGDMRSPDVHRIFDIDRDVGLANVLQGEVNLRDAINRQWSDDIHVLSAGQLTTDPHRLVSGDAFDRLLDEVRDEYATIIIDTPPVLAASEALVMARAADAVLLCTMRDVSRIVQVRTTYKRLIEAGANPVGAVFSGVPMARYYYSYGDYDSTHD